MAELSEREPLLGKRTPQNQETQEDGIEELTREDAESGPDMNSLPPGTFYISSYGSGHHRVESQSPINEITREDAELGPNPNSLRSGAHDRTTSIICFVRILLVVFVASVFPAAILELTQDIRGMKDQDVSDYIKSILICLTIIFIIVSPIYMTSYCKYKISRHNWKVFPIFAMGLVALLSFGNMCTVASPSAADLWEKIMYTIFVILQLICFLYYNFRDPLKANICKSKYKMILYLQIAFALASNVAICIDLIIEDVRNEPPKGWLIYVYPFRFEFLLFCISMWLELFSKHKCVGESGPRGEEDSVECLEEDRPFCCMSKHYFIITPVTLLLTLLGYSYNWVKTCEQVKNMSWNSYNNSNTTNVTISKYDTLKAIIPMINSVIFGYIIVAEVAVEIIIMKCSRQFKTESLKSKEVLLIVCALIFNVYQVAILIPEAQIWANKGQEIDMFTKVEVIKSGLAIFYVIVQTGFILILYRRKVRRWMKPSFLHKVFVQLYQTVIFLNLENWLLSCLEKQNRCVALESSEAYNHYWYILQRTLFPVGIFFQWHSGELLIEIGLSLKSH